eukprot:s4945_g2.t1
MHCWDMAKAALHPSNKANAQPQRRMQSESFEHWEFPGISLTVSASCFDRCIDNQVFVASREYLGHVKRSWVPPFSALCK